VAAAFQAAANWLEPSDIEQLRHYEPASAVKVAADAGIVLSYPQFCQWLYGAGRIPAACKEAADHGVFTAAKEAINLVEEQDYFSVDPVRVNSYSYSTVKPLHRAVAEMKYAGTMEADGIKRRSMTIIETKTAFKQTGIFVPVCESACRGVRRVCGGYTFSSKRGGGRTQTSGGRRPKPYSTHGANMTQKTQSKTASSNPAYGTVLERSRSPDCKWSQGGARKRLPTSRRRA
jgi:hypothetical protein